MDNLLKALQAYGADVSGAMGRFLDDLDLYKACFSIFLEDESFQKLEDAIHAEDYTKAFEYAHTLKGVAGNMGLTPLYEVICSVVEALRSGRYSQLPADCAEIAAHLEKLQKMQSPPTAP